MSEGFLQQLYKSAQQQNLSRNVVDNALEFSRKMCGHVLAHYLTILGEESGNTELIDVIKKSFPDCNTVGSQKISFKEHKLTLVMQFAIVSKEHVISIPVERKYVPEIFKNMDRLVNVMQSYFKTTINLNEVLRAELCKLFKLDLKTGPNLEMSINKHNRNMYLTEDIDKQIGLIAYYEDENGQVVTELTEEALYGPNPEKPAESPEVAEKINN